MNKKIKYFLVGGGVLAIFTFILEAVFLKTCKDGLGCLAVGTVYLIPGTIISNLLGISDINVIKITNIIFYFIIGGLIGLLVYKLKSKNKR